MAEISSVQPPGTACFRSPQGTTLLPSLCPVLWTTARYLASLGSLMVSWQKPDLSKSKSDWATCCSQNPLFLNQDPHPHPCPRQGRVSIAKALANFPFRLTSLPVPHLRLLSSFKTSFLATSQKLPSPESVQINTNTPEQL